MKVLLVDDSATMRRIQKTQLGMLGISDVIEAPNGKEALDILAAARPRPDFILLDWNMPEMDGLTFLKHVRGNDAYAGIKISMCTSEADKDKVMEALKAGANNYIVKPFSPDALKEKLGLQ